MKRVKGVVALLLSFVLVVTLFPLSFGVSTTAEEGVNTDSTQQTSQQDTEDTGTDVINKEDPSDGISDEPDQETVAPEQNENRDAAASPADQADPEPESDKKEEPEKDAGEPAASGAVSGASGWIWKVTGEAGSYTLTFEYTGAGEATAFSVPDRFIANIASSLGSITKNDINSIIVPEKCTSIGSYAFQDMDGIERVEIASTVKTIGNTAFGDNNNNSTSLGCGKLRSVVLKTNAEGKSELTTLGSRVFRGCSSLREITNLDKTQLKDLGNGAFQSTALETVYLPDTLSGSGSRMGDYVFADNSKLKSVNMPALFYINSVYGSGYTFANCSTLETVTFREVAGATQYNSHKTSLPNYFFQNDSNLKTVDLSAWSKASGYNDFTLSESHFSGNNLSNLSNLILPKNKNVIINTNTFKNKHLTSIDNIQNQESITTIGNYAFSGSRITSGNLSRMVKLSSIGQEAFKNCESMTDLVIPESVTTIGSAAFKNCDNLESVRIEAKQLTSVSETNLFHGDDNLKRVTISDKTKKINGNVLAAIPAEADTFFEGINVIEITKAAKKGGSKPIKDLNGTYYVDEKGVLYKLGEDGKASLAYVPPGITSYTVPETFTTPGDGKEYTVTAIEANALGHARDLTAIDFAAPEKVYLKASAFTGWSTSTDNKGKTVQGKESITQDEWGKVSTMCDFPIGEVEGELVETIEDPYKNSDGKEVLKVVVAVNEKQPSADKTYDYLTGQIASYAIAISNDDNTTMDRIVRIYFSYSEDGYKMGSFYEGEYNIKNPSTGTVYPMKVVQTDNPNVYYYEITGILPSETLAFTNDIFYPATETGGGEVKIWTHTISKEKAEETEGQVINPHDYMELDWTTSPVEFDYTKSKTTYYDTTVSRGRTPIIMTDPSGDAYVSALAYRLKESNKSGSSEKTEGTDYIRWVNYSDEITLPDELYWRPEVYMALAMGAWSVEDIDSYYDNGSNTLGCKAITVTVQGKKYYVAYLGGNVGYGRNYFENLKIKVTDEKTLKLTWKVSNTSLKGASADNEYAVQSFYLRFGDNVVLADLDKVNALLDANPGKKLPELLHVHNETDEVRHYSYSPNQTAESSADNPVDANYDVLINKKFQKLDDSNRPNRTAGTDEFFNITIDNTGILNLSSWGAPYTEEGVKKYDGHLIEDTINEYLFIEPQNIEKMLKASVTLGTGKNAGEAQIGDWLTITITKASMFNDSEGAPNSFPYADGTDQSNKYTTNSSSNIAYNRDNSVRALESATMVFTKNAEGAVTVTLSGDPIAENNKTYIIGSGGDYASVKDFFEAIGYMPTRNTIYKADYKLKPDEQFTLKPGQKMVVPILTTIKTTPMLLTQDSESYYPSIYMSLNNKATVRLKVGDEDRQKTYGTKYVHDWYRELYLYKYGYINGSQISNGSTSVKDGSVIDSQLNFYNNSGKAYEHMNVADYMTGAQVALVSKVQNPNLKAPDGSELDTYMIGIDAYYVLNKPGTYEDVVFGSTARTGSGATPIYKADITVTETTGSGKRTSLNTLFKWEPFKNWGGTSTSYNIFYKSLVSATMSGLAGADNPGEVKTYELNNKAWLGDHQGHRLWDTMGVYAQVYSFNKYIVSNDGGKGDGTDSVSDGTLTKFSRLRQSDSVTYQITINNTSTAPTVLNGSRIYDYLPSNKGVFSWEKGVNVTNLRYYGSEGVEIKYGSGESAVNIPTDGKVDSSAEGHWRIENTSTSGQQQIKWDNSFNVHFPVSGTLKILVDLKFPERTEGVSAWDQYVSEAAGKQLKNTFHLDGRTDEVSHLLESEGKAVLYKGVYDNGLTTKNPGNTDDSTWKYGLYTSNNTRLMYQNGTGSNSISDTDLKASTITYYTVLYNGSYDRLYLSDLEDVLPKGFTYNSMCYTASTRNRIDNNSSSNTGYIGYRASAANTSVTTEQRGNQLVTIDKSGDPYDKNTLVYKAAYVVPTTSMVDGRQHVKFKISGVGYDSEVGKYYLNPGEAVRFGYNVLVDQYSKTDDEATNTITMPYYDYYHTGFILDAPDAEGNGGAVQKARAVSGITPNDGKCELMTGEQVKANYGMDISNYTDDAYNSNEKGNFMVSSVTVHRAPITPGLQKTIAGLTEKANNPVATTVEGPRTGYGSAYKGGAKTSDIVNWKLRMYNEAPGKNDEAGGMMTDYTITDTVDSPFGFTGRVYYDMYRNTSANGTKVTKATQYLFTIGSRKIADSPSEQDTKVRFSSGDTLTASGYRDVTIGSAEDDSDDDWFSFGTGAKSGKVKLERNADGKEILTIKMTGTGYSIPAGHWIDLCLHTMYMIDEVIISEPKYNTAILYPEQDYEASNVAQGRARTKQVTEEDGSIVTKNDGIQSGASIMLNQGYTSSAWKEIKEIGSASNKARSDDSSNYIVLSEKTKSVQYDLYVVGPTTSISKMVVIDDLPHIGDHSAFVKDDKRESEFSVGFLEDNLGLTVSLAQKTGTSGGVNQYGPDQVLDKSKYETYVSAKTEFDRDTDWIGTGDGWTRIDDLQGDDLKAVLKEARSIRVVVRDPNAWQTDSSKYELAQEPRLHITFNARINDSNAQPGQIAWNSFGYKYEVPLTRRGTEEDSKSIYLEAQPLNVGMKYPNAPVLKKKLTEDVVETVEKTDEETGETTEEEVTKVVEHITEKDLQCNFIIYEGDPLDGLNDITGKEDAEIAEILSAAGRKYIYVPLTVKAGESETEKGLWSVDYCSIYENGKFVDDTEQKWTWINDAKYTLLEMNMIDSDIYDLSSISLDGKEYESNNHVFANTLDRKIELTADNRYSNVDLILTKKMPTRVDTNMDGNDANSTVVFKIEGTNKSGEVVYKNTVGMTFNGEIGAYETKILHDVPSDVVLTVKEVYAGNYSAKEAVITKTKVETYSGELEEYQGQSVWLFEFENTHEGDSRFGSGIVNQYENKDGVIKYNDGKKEEEPAGPEEPKE